MDRNNTKRIIRIGLFAAICFVGTMIHFPITLGGSPTMIHLGTTAIFMGAIFIGKDVAWAGAIGCALFDFINPTFAIWTVPTFFLKGATGYVTGAISHKNDKNGEEMKQNIIAFILGGLVSLVGYFFINCLFYGVGVAFIKLSTSLITTTIAIIITIPLCASTFLVKKAGIKI